MGTKRCGACKGTGTTKSTLDGRDNPCSGCGGSGEIETPDPQVRDNILKRWKDKK
jgi:DnaJ-class molecular chaperone